MDAQVYDESVDVAATSTYEREELVRNITLCHDGMGYFLVAKNGLPSSISNDMAEGLLDAFKPVPPPVVHKRKHEWSYTIIHEPEYSLKWGVYQVFNSDAYMVTRCSTRQKAREYVRAHIQVENEAYYGDAQQGR